jgi:DNA-binding MarR family transcriptional regulator
MKLELEIKQIKKFRNAQHKLSVNLTYTSNWYDEKKQKFFKKYNLTFQQFNILRILRGQYPNASSIKLLKERMIDKMSDASRLVENLLKKDLVIRTISQEDRRHADVFINENGLIILEKLDKLIPKFEKKHLSNLTEEETQQLNELLDKLRG